MKISNRGYVSTPFETNKNLPISFTFLTFGDKKGVMLTLQGDVSNVNNLQKELEEVKQIVNREINKENTRLTTKIKLRDVDIKIEFVEIK